jgi:hypothetical protein
VFRYGRFGEHAAPSSGLKCVGSEIISVNREVKRKVIMTPKERKKIEKPGLTQWEEMDKKDQKGGLIGDTLVYHQSENSSF